jgi:hypothetical protein
LSHSISGIVPPLLKIGILFIKALGDTNRPDARSTTQYLYHYFAKTTLYPSFERGRVPCVEGKAGRGAFTP